MSTVKNIKIQKGRRFSFHGTITFNGKDYDLTGYTMKFEVKENPDDVSFVTSVTLTPDPDQVSNTGEYTGVLLPSVTRTLTSRNYYYEINIYDGTGNYVYTPTSGTITMIDVLHLDPTV